MAKTIKQIDTDMILFIGNEGALILKGFNILEDTKMFKDSYKTEVETEIKLHYENISKMIKSIEDKKTILPQSKFTDVELKNLKVID